jgi:hypothetical protein
MAALCLTACEADTITGSNGSDLKTTPTIAVTPVSLSFRIYAFDPARDPPPQVLSITNGSGGGLVWSARDNLSWITLGSTTGTAPSRLRVRLDRAGLHLGINGYRPQHLTGTITLSAAGASNTPLTIPVGVVISYLRPSQASPGGNPRCGRRCNAAR